MSKIMVKAVVTYKGHSVSANGAVNLSMKAKYEELINSMQLLQMLNNDVAIVAKLPDSSPSKLGMFRIKNVTFDGDGESVIKFDSISDYVDLEAIGKLIGSELFQVKFGAEIQEEIEQQNEESVQ
jgi:hypothetical protein